MTRQASDRERRCSSVAVADQVREIVLPLLPAHDVELYDLEVSGPLVRVVIDRQGGLDLGVLASVTRAVSRALDDADPIVSRYTLEVTSPGVERPLRTPEQYQRAIGEVVKVKTTPDAPGDRRVQGELVKADDSGITVRPDDADDAAPETGEAAEPVERTLAYEQIERARTVFEWGTPAKPGKVGGGRTTSPGSRKKRERRS
jgi:ribosome maturation factor RimP